MVAWLAAGFVGSLVLGATLALTFGLVLNLYSKFCRRICLKERPGNGASWNSFDYVRVDTAQSPLFQPTSASAQFTGGGEDSYGEGTDANAQEGDGSGTGNATGGVVGADGSHSSGGEGTGAEGVDNVEGEDAADVVASPLTTTMADQPPPIDVWNRDVRHSFRSRRSRKLARFMKWAHPSRISASVFRLLLHVAILLSLYLPLGVAIALWLVPLWLGICLTLLHVCFSFVWLCGDELWIRLKCRRRLAASTGGELKPRDVSRIWPWQYWANSCSFAIHGACDTMMTVRVRRILVGRYNRQAGIYSWFGPRGAPFKARLLTFIKTLLTPLAPSTWKAFVDACRVRQFYSHVVIVSQRLRTVFLVSLAVIVCYIIPLATTYGFCFVDHPYATSTSLSRYYALQQELLQDTNMGCFAWSHYTPCATYVLVGDKPNSFFLNFITTKQLTKPRVLLWSVAANINETEHAATYTTIPQLRHEERYVYSVYVENLLPDTMYTFVGGDRNSHGDREHPDGWWSTAMNFRTHTTATNSSASVLTFLSGGDIGLSEQSRRLMDTSVDGTAPMFALIGGDISYANSFPMCVSRWDAWFVQWMEHMQYRYDGTVVTVPILTSIGNHEVGGRHDAAADDAIFYQGFFPHHPDDVARDDVPYSDRKTYSVHRVNEDVAVMVLDTGHVADPSEQVSFISDTLYGLTGRRYGDEVPARNATGDGQLPYARFVFPLYHVPLYPSVRTVKTINEELQELWGGAFEGGGVRLSFENHDHAYKRTYPLRHGAVATNDTTSVVYVGDGAWGATPREVTHTPKWYEAATERTGFVLTCTIQRFYDSTIPNDIQVQVVAVRPDATPIETFYRNMLPYKGDTSDGEHT